MKPINVLGREYSVQILRATAEPKSAPRLSDTLSIPVATCYRRISELVDVGLLKHCETHSTDSGESNRYQRTTDAVGIRFDTPSFFAWTLIEQANDVKTFPLGESTGSPAQSHNQVEQRDTDELAAEADGHAHAENDA